MAKTKYPECEIWCPRCKTPIAKVFRQEIRDGIFEYVSMPKTVPKFCTTCEIPVVRKAG